MARRNTLHAVKAPTKSTKPADEQKPKAPARAATVAQAVKSGNRRDLLVAMRDRLAKAVSAPSCPARELGVLMTKLEKVIDDIAAIDEAAQESEAEDTVDSRRPDDNFDASAI